MAMPVQTWGTLGSMVAEQKEFGDQTAEFLECNEVYDLFGQLLRQLIVVQPDNPIKFLQDQLRQKPPLCVCVIGPPGINRAKFCAQIASDYKIKHIHAGKLLRAKKELKNDIEAGNLIEDGQVIPMVKAELEKSKGQGWVLDGFPRTKVQAQALAGKENGFSLDKVLLLHTGEKAIRQRFAAKVAASGYSGAEQEDIINTRLQQYQRHVISIAELYKNVIRQIEVGGGDDDQNLTYSLIKSNLDYRPYANAPLRAHRICVVGACGSGRSTQCRTLSKDYGLVHVDLANLIRKHQKATGQLQEEVPPEFVSDEEICGMVGRRLNEIDCLRKGWILDGFPKTQAQAEFLRQSHFWPTRLIHLKMNEDQILTRLAARKLDPVTGTAYYRPPTNVAIRSRLITAYYDELEAVKSRFDMHERNVESVLQVFPQVKTTMFAGGEIPMVTRAMKEDIDKPRAHELAQDPANKD